MARLSRRLLHIINAGGHGRLQLGGAERAVAELTTVMIDKYGWDVAVAGPSMLFDKRRFHPKVRRYVFDPYDGPTASLHRIVRTVEPSILVTHLLRGTFLGIPLGALHRVPVRVSILHNSLTQTFTASPPPWYRRVLYRATFLILTRAWTDTTLAISDANRADLIHRDGVPRHKIELIPAWVSDIFDRSQRVAWRDATRAELGFAENARVVAVVGRLEPQKGQDFLISLLPSLEDVHLLLIGEGARRHDYAQLAESAGVADRVKFLGFVDHAERVIAASDVVAVPSRYEGFGRAAIEACALGVPVVASNVDGLPSVLRDAPEGARLVSLDDVDAWRNALGRALDESGDPAMAAALSQFVAERYSLQLVAERFNEMLERLVAEKGCTLEPSAQPADAAAGPCVPGAARHAS